MDKWSAIKICGIWAGVGISVMFGGGFVAIPALIATVFIVMKS